MLKVQNLEFNYPYINPLTYLIRNKKPRKLLLKNLNLSLEPGHIYGLLGKNGEGKTTLLKNLMGLSFPQKGNCTYKNENVRNRSVQILQDLFFLPEEIYSPNLSLLKYMAINSPFYPRFSKEDFEKNLQHFDLDTRANLQSMSYGQQKKGFIAFALAANPRFLLMDEPTNGLDIPSKSQFRKLVASSLNDEKSIILSTHQIRDLESLIDSILILDKGEIKVNAGIEFLTEKLLFKEISFETENSESFQEISYGGKKIIFPNLKGDTSAIDLEFLFNAVIAENPIVLNALKSE